MKIQIIVAAHKAYRMPTDPMYLPLHVGKAGKDLALGFQGDNTGENISEKNATYCELTGLYWAWKNLDADYIGLAHYRRHFRGKSGKDKWDCILTTAQAEQLLQDYDVLVPKRRNYYIETAYNQYVHAHPAEPLDLMISLVSAQGENYRAAAEAMRHRTWTHIYNMFIMKRDIFDGYCQWMFDILGQVEAQIDISGYSAYDRRGVRLSGRADAGHLSGGQQDSLPGGSGDVYGVPELAEKRRRILKAEVYFRERGIGLDHTLRELQLCELELVKAVLSICETHHLTVFMMGGTFLGAVRHQGFIPWDDDVDLGMSRSDYETFLQVAPQELPQGYVLRHLPPTRICPITLPRWWIPALRFSTPPRRLPRPAVLGSTCSPWTECPKAR